MNWDFPLVCEEGQDIAGTFFHRSMGLPRTLIVNRDGIVVYQAFSYTEEEFQTMLKKLKETLDHE